MPLTLSDVRRLVRILGQGGASAGLKASDVPTRHLRDLSVEADASLGKASNRDAIVEGLVGALSRPMLKPVPELMTMSFEDILKYFELVRIPNVELLRLASELNLKVGTEERKHLRRFMARQISENALFSRVANRDNN